MTHRQRFLSSDWSFKADLVLFIVSSLALLVDLVGHLSGSQRDFFLAIFSFAGLVPVLRSALRALFRKQLTVDLLAFIALVFSLVGREWHSAIFISLMLISARLFSRYTQDRARDSLKSLLRLRPNKAHLKTETGIKEVPLESLKVGDLVLVNDGERIPVDGVIVEGRAVVDQSSLTGESLPQLKEVGESVFSSTLSLEGDFVMKAMRVGRDTTFDKILALVESSQQAKAPISSLADKFVNWYIFLVVLGSALIYFLTHDLRLLLSILLVTCADDLAVAIPLAFTAAIGLAAHRGVVIKGGKFLEGLDRVRTMVVDKTGTITQGKLEVKNHLVFNDFSDQDFLSLLGAMVERSNHPTARAISSFIRRQNVALAQVNDVYEESGYGIFAKFQGETVAVGRPGFVEGKGIQFSPAERETFEKEKNLGRSVIVLGKGKRVMGFISLSDSVRANAQRVMREVKNRGVKRIVMLTGDNERVAQEVAEKVGISEFKADLLPQAKLEFLKKTMVDTKGKVLMLGDGVNDAPALTLADIGCAMGAMGSEAAIESADIVLMRDDLGILPRLFDLSHYTLRVVRQDLLIWGLTNVFGLVLVFAHVIGPWGAAVFNFLTDFLPLLNSLKLFKMHLQSHSSKT